MTRRSLLLAAATETRADRIRRQIAEYESQGFHRTGTAADRRSGDWLARQVRAAGAAPALEAFELSRVDPVTPSLTAEGRRIEGLPLYDAAFTGPRGVSGLLGADIALTETTPNAAAAGALGEARRSGRHRAIVCVTRGGRPGLCPSNADSFLSPFGPPVLQVSSEYAEWLGGLARRGASVEVIAHARRTRTRAYNVTARIAGAGAPLVVMTPRSGWWACASERGGGIACWLETIRELSPERPEREVLFVASSGHELGHLGINAFVDRRPGILKRSHAWIHLGANLGAATSPDGGARPATDAPPEALISLREGNTLQASDDEMESMMDRALSAASLGVARRNPRDRVPAGEAEVPHRGGARYVSVIGRNGLFHHPEDRGPEVVDIAAIAGFCDAVTEVARGLAGAPSRGSH
jgi:hypothetical protein